MLAFSLCERSYVLETGRIAVEGPSSSSAIGPRCAAPTSEAERPQVTFLQLVVVGISTGSVFGIIGIALVLVYRTTGIVNFAQGVFAVLGGVFTFEFAQHIPMLPAIVAAVLLSAVLATVTAVVAPGSEDGRRTSRAS